MPTGRPSSRPRPVICPAPWRRPFEEAVAVHHRADHGPHVEDLAAVGRDDAGERCIAAIAWIGAGGNGRQFPDIGRQVAQEPAQGSEGGGLVFHHVVDDAGLLMHSGTAELILVHGAAKRAFHQGGAADQHLRGVARHHAIV